MEEQRIKFLNDYTWMKTKICNVLRGSIVPKNIAIRGIRDLYQGHWSYYRKQIPNFARLFDRLMYKDSEQKNMVCGFYDMAIKLLSV